MSAWKRQQQIDTSDDVALVHAAKQGDMAAFEQLAERYTAMIFRVLSSRFSSAVASGGLS